MRGKDIEWNSAIQGNRITPAHAGKSLFFRNIGIFKQDHPRPCGEKKQTTEQAWDNVGSPPPMRGKVRKGTEALNKLRITPAHAGKRQASHSYGLPARDHPRPCGEKLSLSAASWLITGSPPPMRGKDRERKGRNVVKGITPAHAGKRSM